MTASRLPVTVIVAAKNEAANIRECLESVRWADQTFVVDSNSTDGTQEIARELGADVRQFNYAGGWPKKRNWALETLPIRNEWILVLDADERVDRTLQADIQTAILAADVDAYYLRWKFVFLNRWMKHCWNHGWMLRLFRKGSASYEDLGMRGEAGWDAEVHENLVTQGRTARLKSFLVHDTNQDIHYWIRKQNDFSTWNALRRTRQGERRKPAPITWLFSRDPVKTRAALKAIYLRLPLKPSLMFLYLYVFKFGFLDGRAGYYFCALRAAHELNIETKIYELRLAAATQAAGPQSGSIAGKERKPAV